MYNLINFYVGDQHASGLKLTFGLKFLDLDSKFNNFEIFHFYRTVQIVKIIYF